MRLFTSLVPALCGLLPGCETVDVSLSASIQDQIENILGVPEVECSMDCVGFEACGCGHDHSKEVPAQVLNSVMKITKAGGAIVAS